MTESSIKNYYKFFAFLNIGFGVIYVFTDNEEELSGRIGAIIFLNIFYHLSYFFIKNLKYDINTINKADSIINYNLRLAMMKLFSFMTMGMSIIIALYLIHSTINGSDFHNLFIIFIPIGLFLGGLSLKLNLYGK